MLQDNQMIVTDQDGNESVCEILFTHEHEGKNYVVFEFVDTHEVSAARYIPGETDDEGSFEDIETDEEWDMLDKVLQSYYDDNEIDLDEEEEETEA
ncbi:MAG: DUF1292 domain-containing protein [Acholeplasmataceae bacterium]|nr:DUF1292 domain-containing protein [Acholeplasmataceae bacterium]